MKLAPKVKLALGGILVLLVGAYVTRKRDGNVGISIAVDCDPSSVNYQSKACAGGEAYGGDALPFDVPVF